MSNKIERKIYYFFIRMEEEGENSDFVYYDLLIDEIIKNYKSYELNYTDNSKDYTIKSVNGFKDATDKYNKLEMVLRYCKYNFTPSVYDVSTKTLTESSKNKNQGDEEKTHFIIFNNKIYAEYKHNGASISILSKFLKKTWSNIKENNDELKNITIHIEKEMDSDVIEKLEKSIRIKRMVIRKTGNFNTDFYDDETQEYTRFEDISISAKRGKSLKKETIIERMKEMLSEKDISKVSIEIIDDDNQYDTILLDNYAKKRIIYVSKDSNGTIDSNDIFLEMRKLL